MVADQNMPRGAFVMSHYSDHPRIREHTRVAVESIQRQTDPDWSLIIVDDLSPRTDDVLELEAMRAADPERIVLLRNDENVGQGSSRNRAVAQAHRLGCDFVMFLDCDDVAHPRRLEVTRQVFANPEIVFVYSPFTVIDEDGQEWARDRLTPSIGEILDQYDKDPLQGLQCWIRMATDTGYATLTSTVSVRTPTMLRYPFPRRTRGMEDVHCWMRIFSGDGLVHFEDGIPGQYRIPAVQGGSSERARIGPDFYRILVNVHRQSYIHALLSALKRGAVPAASAGEVYLAAITRLRTTVLREGQDAVAADLSDEMDMLSLALDGVDPVDGGRTAGPCPPNS